MNARIKELFQAFSSRNYRIYFAGQGISLIGTWMQRTTMGWYVYRLTSSPFLLGLIVFFSQIPSVFIGPFAGVWADRHNRQTILKVTQFVALIQAVTLALLVLSGKMVILYIMGLSILSGITEAIDAPARQSFIIELIKKRTLLTNAIAMNSAMFNGARLIGPSFAGIIIALSNEGICFLINGISYLAVIISLFMIKVPIRKKVEKIHSTLINIKQGWHYSFKHLPIRFLIENVSVITFFGMSYAVLMPVFAKDILNGTSQTMGFLLSMAGVGALIGALYLASRKSINGLSRKMVYALTLFSLTLIGFSFSKSFSISLLLMLFIGFGMMFQMAASNTILQNVVADEMRGRVMSLHSMAFMSVAPFGSLFVGFMSKKIGAPYALAVCAIICLFWSIYGMTMQKKCAKDVDEMLNLHIESVSHSDQTTLVIPVVRK